jgi:hypothetical protein
MGKLPVKLNALGEFEEKLEKEIVEKVKVQMDFLTL